MSRLIVTAFSIMLGVAVHAAAVTWAVSNVQSSPDATVGAGWVVQLFDSSVEYDYTKALNGEIEARFTGATEVNNTSFKASTKELNAAAANESVSLYMVIYDANTIEGAQNYIVSEVVSKTVAASDGDITLSFGSMKGTTTANKFLNSSWTAAVPEPTSGLLLLVGGALLALRRKQK